MSNDSGWQQPSSDQGRPYYGDVPRYGQFQPPTPGQPPAPAPPWTQPPPPGTPYGPPAPYGQGFPPPTGTPAPWGTPGQVPGDPSYPYAHPYGSTSGAPIAPPPLASWGRRVGAYLIDTVGNLVAYAVFMIGYVQFIAELSGNPDNPDFSVGTGYMIAGGLLALAALGWQIYNRWITAGRTGQSLGKRVLKIKLIGEQTLQPIGALNAFLRDLVHILDGIAYVGYLWPLWDDKRQTFSDKIMKTVVVDAEPPTAHG